VSPRLWSTDGACGGRELRSALRCETPPRISARDRIRGPWRSAALAGGTSEVFRAFGREFLPARLLQVAASPR